MKSLWHAPDYEVLDDEGRSLLKLRRISWADWDSSGIFRSRKRAGCSAAAGRMA
jgi:hypothetical protein